MYKKVCIFTMISIQIYLVNMGLNSERVFEEVGN